MGVGSPLLDFSKGCQFNDSFVKNNGLALAAVVVQGSQPGQNVSFDNCVIRNDKVTGIYARPMANSSIFIRNSEVSGNVPQTIGGGIVVANDGVQIINSKITGNQTALDGGAVVYQSFSVPISRTLIINSLIAGNRAGRNGGGVAVNQTAVSVLNSTIAGNSAAFGGGVWLDWYGGGATPDSTGHVRQHGHNREHGAECECDRLAGLRRRGAPVSQRGHACDRHVRLLVQLGHSAIAVRRSQQSADRLHAAGTGKSRQPSSQRMRSDLARPNVEVGPKLDPGTTVGPVLGPAGVGRSWVSIAPPMGCMKRSRGGSPHALKQ